MSLADELYEAQRSRLLALLQRLSYEQREVTLASGAKSNFYIDCKQTVLTAEGHFLVGSLFGRILATRAPEVEAIGGVSVGADPLASAVSTISFVAGRPLPAFYVRKEAKGHGTGAWIEGTKSLRTGMPVAILEDVVTTGGSALKAIARVREHGLRSPSSWASSIAKKAGARCSKSAPSRCFAAAISYNGPMAMTGRSALLVVAALVACQSDKAARVDFSETPRNYVANDYRDVYDRWTRHDFVMHDVEKALEVWATFKSWDFREAYIERYAAIYSLSDADRDTLRAGAAGGLTRPTSFTSPRRARTTSGTTSRNRARPGG